MMSPNQEFSFVGERFVYNRLKSLGYHPTPTDFNTPNCDMRVAGLPIGVKLARKTMRKLKNSDGSLSHYPRWQWSVSATSQDMGGEWVLVLLAQLDDGKIVPFVVPGSQVGERSHLQITSHPDQYSGWLARYRNKWDVISYLSQETYLDDGPTFEQWQRVAA